MNRPSDAIVDVGPATFHGLSATVRLAMKALMSTGHYDETGDALEWLVREATDVAAAITGRVGYAGQVAVVIALLTDTAFHDPTQPDQAACLRRDAEDVVTAVTTGVVHESKVGR
jgi:hypothetical protein